MHLLVKFGLLYVEPANKIMYYCTLNIVAYVKLGQQLLHKGISIILCLVTVTS